MKLINILEKLIFPLLLISLFFISTTFMASLTSEMAWQRIGGVNLHRIFQLLDLREENTLATWFSSIIFLSTSLAFVLLGWGFSPALKISPLTQKMCQVVTMGACLLSADEVASIHETLGKWFGRLIFKTMVDYPVEDNGFLWVPLLAPLFLMGFFMAIHILYTLITPMQQYRRWALLTLASALICLPLGVFLSEILESQGISVALLTCIEEACELIGMYSLFASVVLVAKEYQL